MNSNNSHLWHPSQCSKYLGMCNHFTLTVTLWGGSHHCPYAVDENSQSHKEPALEHEQTDSSACPLDLIKLVGQLHKIGDSILILQMRSRGPERLITLQQLLTHMGISKSLVSNPHSKAFPCFSHYTMFLTLLHVPCIQGSIHFGESLELANRQVLKWASALPSGSFLLRNLPVQLAFIIRVNATIWTASPSME